MVAEVIINKTTKKLNRVFDYEIPKEFEGLVVVGSKVFVPFGKSEKLETAYVVKVKEKSDFEVKQIVKLDENLTNNQIILARWMAKKYFCNLSDCVKLMITPGTLNPEKETRERKVQIVQLKINEEELKNLVEEKTIKNNKHINILKYLLEHDGIPITQLEEESIASRAVIKTLEKHGYVEIKEEQVERNPLKDKEIERDDELILNMEQRYAYDQIEESMINNEFKTFLLHGVTGSGKTEIYMQLIKKAIEEEKTAILLVPEISLTPQMTDRFISRFGKDIIAILHSKLSIGERHDEWNRIKEKKAKIIIGARSAIFSPLEDIGIIIIDEEHDSSYKSESTPRYDAKEVAKCISIQNKCPLLLGSATPDINTYYKAVQKGEIELLELTRRANNAEMPEVTIIDLKQELANGNRSMLSRELYSAIEENLKNKKQTILFLNRRGYSTFIMCRNCGYTVKCKNCDISMTYHSYEHKLKCHYCGHEEPLVTKCPECGSDKIRYFGTGTQKLEEEIIKQFPSAKTIRMDVDTVTKKNSHEKILKSFRDDGIDILIGTQMVVKGHHFPNVTLVGVMTADSSLNIDDYRASERTFQILTQVAGRAGRGKEKGRVIIQSYNPDNYSIQTARKQSYEEFYETEIAVREQLKYPPFGDIILIGINGSKLESLTKVEQDLYKILKEKLEGKINVFRPMPAPIEKIQNRIRHRIIMKGYMTEEINKILNDILNRIYQKDLKDIRITIDVNPNNMS